MKELIITADDYGMCEYINDAIEMCIKSGVVLSTNVMANMDSADNASKLKVLYPNLSLGIHYNFTVGKPISPIKEVASLVDEKGIFLSFSEIRKRLKKRNYRFDEVAAEMAAQYNSYVNICGKPDYWNTHENIHVYPELYQLFRDVSYKFGIKKMRSHRRIYIPSSNGKTDKSLKWILTNPIKQSILSYWQKFSFKIGVSAPDGLMVCFNNDDKLDLNYLFANINWKNNNIAEMVIHPATNSYHEYYGDLTNSRKNEFVCFSDASALKNAENNGIKITSFMSIK